MGATSELDIPRQQFIDAVGWVTGDARDEAAEICLGVEAAEFGGFDDGVDGGGAVVSAVGAGEGPVFASDGQGTDSAFGSVVADVETSVSGVARQCVPAREGIADGLSQRTLAADLVHRLFEPGLHLRQQRHRPFGTHSQTFLRHPPTNAGFNGEQLADAFPV